MKKIILLLAVICSTILLDAQNLVIGYTDPNEVITLTSGTFSYDTLYILNNGKLNISNQVSFTVNNFTAITGTAELSVQNSDFTANNIFYMIDSSSTHFRDSISLACSFYLINHANLYIDSAVVNIPMTYKSQYSWAVGNNAGIDINEAQFNLGSGSLGGNFVDSSYFHQSNTDYISSILPMTMGIAGNSSLVVDSCSGGMEFVISENADVNIQHSNFFVIWYSFADGDTANYAYPPANSTLTNASHITNDYYFSDTTSGVSGVDFSIHIADADYVFWGIISQDNSDVIVNNSTLSACGFYFDGTSENIASGMNDSQFYTSFQAPFNDRGFKVNNTKVEAWNFYPSDTSVITIDSCIYGESLGFLNGTTIVKNSTCDGTGGYFGGLDNSKTYVYNSQIIRISGAQQIINFQNNSEAWFYNSSITGTSVLNNNSIMYFANTKYNNVPIENNNSYFAEAWLDTLNNNFTDSIISIKGKVWGINGPLNTSEITRYVISYSLPDSTSITTIKDTSASSFNMFDVELANWDTQGIISGNYLVWLNIFVDGNSVITCNRNVFLDNTSKIQYIDNQSHIDIFPNPATNITYLDYSLTENQTGKLIIYSILGKIENTYFLESGENKLLISTKNLMAGIYFCKVYINNKMAFTKKLIIVK